MAGKSGRDGGEREVGVEWPDELARRVDLTMLMIVGEDMQRSMREGQSRVDLVGGK